MMLTRGAYTRKQIFEEIPFGAIILLADKAPRASEENGGHVLDDWELETMGMVFER